jgi:hypothetical protein
MIGGLREEKWWLKGLKKKNGMVGSEKKKISKKIW